MTNARRGRQALSYHTCAACGRVIVPGAADGRLPVRSGYRRYHADCWDAVRARAATANPLPKVDRDTAAKLLYPD